MFGTIEWGRRNAQPTKTAMAPVLTALTAAMTIAALAIGAPLVSAQSASAWELHILHINDLHSRIEPVNRFNSTCSQDDRDENKCYGGVARIKAWLDKRRNELDGKPVLTLDAGDQFQGSLFYTRYKGMAAAEFMNTIGFDAMALGNHEFDNGPKVAQQFINEVSFPVLGANVNVSAGAEMEGVAPIAIMEVANRKIGIIGVVAEDTGATSSPGPNVSFDSVVDAVNEAAISLAGRGIDTIVLLSHVGLPADQRYISKISGIDVVVGGHSHTLLSNTDDKAEGPYPVVATDRDGNQVPIVQAWAYSRIVGDLVLELTEDGKVTGWRGEAVPMSPDLPEDAAVAARVATLAEPLEEIRKTPVGTAGVDIDGDRANCRAKECTMGVLVTDALLWKTKDQGTEIAIQNGGGLRTSIAKGTITMGHVLTVLPFQNAIATFKLKGSDVVAALQHGTSGIEEGAGRFPQVAGLRYQLDPNAAPGTRVSNVEVRAGNGWKAIDSNRLYSVVSNDYMRRGGDGYDVFRDEAVDAYDFGPSLEDAVADYIREQGTVSPALEGRINIQ